MGRGRVLAVFPVETVVLIDCLPPYTIQALNALEASVALSSPSTITTSQSAQQVVEARRDLIPRWGHLPVIAGRVAPLRLGCVDGLVHIHSPVRGAGTGGGSTAGSDSLFAAPGPQVVSLFSTPVAGKEPTCPLRSHSPEVIKEHDVGAGRGGLSRARRPTPCATATASALEGE